MPKQTYSPPDLRAQDFVARLRGAADEDDAIEMVYDQMHKLIQARDYGVIDEFLRLLSAKEHVNAVLLSILTITALSEVRAFLPSRPAFFGRVKDCVTDREGPEGAEELLVGLE
jgi:hypothetical protein